MIHLDLGWCWDNDRTTNTAAYQTSCLRAVRWGCPTLFGKLASETPDNITFARWLAEEWARRTRVFQPQHCAGFYL